MNWDILKSALKETWDDMVELGKSISETLFWTLVFIIGISAVSLIIILIAIGIGFVAHNYHILGLLIVTTTIFLCATVGSIYLNYRDIKKCKEISDANNKRRL